MQNWKINKNSVVTDYSNNYDLAYECKLEKIVQF